MWAGWSATSGGSITQSYATGAVSGTSDVGGLVGYNDGGSITQSYWDSYTTGQAAGIGTWRSGHQPD